jgi:hypothetical protein
MAEVAVSRQIFQEILSLLARLRATRASMRELNQMMRQGRRPKCVSMKATLPGYSASARSTGHFRPPAARAVRVCRCPRRLIERS